MDGGNRAVIYASVPAPLKELVRLYGSYRGKQAFSEALVELLETHPAIAEMATRVYAEGDRIPTGEESPA